MSKMPFQWNYEIKGLIPEPVRLKRKIWLKRREILLEKKNKTLYAFVLGMESDHGEEKIVPYLWISCLISRNAPEITGGSGSSLKSPNELGTKPILKVTISSRNLPELAVGDIEHYAPKFLRFLSKLHDKYVNVIKENDFLAIALNYFWEAEKKSIYNNEGLISAMISMEALFNDGPSDIKYKLSHRAAFLLGLSGLDPIEAFKKLKEFYDNRSSLVHSGSNLKYDADRYLVSKYAGRSLKIFMILLKNSNRQSQSAKKRKTEVLLEIDHAMLSLDSSRSLKKEIIKGMNDFNLKIPRTFEGNDEGRDYRVTAW